jgi:hypothetical protein
MPNVYRVEAWLRGSAEPATVTLFNCSTPKIARVRALAMLRAEAGMRGVAPPDVVWVRARQASDGDTMAAGETVSPGT